MVKQNSDSDGKFAPSVILDSEDRELVRNKLSDTKVNPADARVIVENDKDTLVIEIRSKSRSELNNRIVEDKLKEVAEKTGFDSSNIQRSNFPSQEEPRTYNNIEETHYKIEVKF